MKTLSVKGKINYQETEGEKVATRAVLSSVFVGFREPRAGFGWVAWLDGAPPTGVVLTLALIT